MSNDKSRFVVSADFVEKQLGAPQFRIVDAAWYLPAQNRNGAAEYAAGHIPGAVFFDQDVIADHSGTLPHTVPSPEFFAAEVGKLGISDTDTIVVYDGPGIFTAPRVWWLLRTMGAKNVFVLDGGLDGWKKEGRPLETDLPEPAPAVFHTNFNPYAVTSFEEMRGIVTTGARQIADARGAGRFTGEEAEPATCRAQKACRRAPFPRVAGSRISPVCVGISRKPASTFPGRSSRPAVRASPPPSSRWPCIRSAMRTTRSMTAPGPNGAAGTTRPW
jgi:3-mercaptopyruvate sulfurtransferase SseA